MGRSFFVQFFDDIRLELGRKRSFMGTYTGMMISTTYADVPKRIAATVAARSSMENPFRKFAVSAVIAGIDDPKGERSPSIHSIEIDPGRLKVQGDAARESARACVDVFGDGPYPENEFTTNTDLVVEPIPQISGPSRLVIRIETEVGLEYVSGLMILDQAGFDRFEARRNELLAPMKERIDSAIIRSTEAANASRRKTKKKRPTAGRG